MTLPFKFLIIYIVIIKRIYSKNKVNDFKYLQNIISEKYYNKILEDYDINIQINNIENKTITKEIHINTPYLSNIYNFVFIYSGNFLYINETGLDLISYQNKNWILLIESEYILNYYISNYKKTIKKLTKAIILPKNTIDNLNLTAKTFYFSLSIFLIELNKEIFNQLIESYINNYNKNSHINYSALIITKKYELFIYLDLINKACFILIFLILINYLYQVNKNKNIFYKIIEEGLRNKLLIFFLLLIDLYNISYINGIYAYKRTLLIKCANFIIIINKYYITARLLFFLSGHGLYIKLPKFYFRIKFYLCILSFLLSLYINIFVSASKFVYNFYFTNLFLYSQIAFFIIFLSIKNIIYLFRINFEIKKKIEYKKYLREIKFKLCIYIFQFIAFIFYIYYMFFLNQYFLFKNELSLELERLIIMESMEVLLLLIIAILYLPKYDHLYGFKSFIRIHKLNHYKIHIRPNYHSNIPKPNRLHYIEYINFIRKNNGKAFAVLMPKAFLNKNKNKNLGNNFDKKIKVGIFHRG